ncbi:hypothetical protein AGMMS49938_00590 [Fibrobacterales bacterium]|nr:hypothetical protein AGMMS49938_00590 [Fibrobacterales bacterium]
MLKNLLFLSFIFALFACSGDGSTGENDGSSSSVTIPSSSSSAPAESSSSSNVVIPTGKVTFVNYTSYEVIIHLDAFSGAVLDSVKAGQSKTIDVRTSDNHGLGTTFCIEYKYKIFDGIGTASGEVYAYGIDPNVQIQFNIEANQKYTKQIPQPAELEFKMAFIKILNSSTAQFELNYLGNSYKQTGNGNLPVPPGQSGIYQIESTASGKPYTGWTVTSVFTPVAIPDFTAEHGTVYNFTYNGTSVVLTGEPKIIF